MPPPSKPVHRIRKQKARRRAEHLGQVPGRDHGQTDSNVTEILPVSAREREAQKEALRDQLRTQQPETRQSAQKRKRLDKYIETKLRKEESTELIRKLASQPAVDTSLLRSSKKLGRVGESKRELLGRILREKRAGLTNALEDDILHEQRAQPSRELYSPSNASPTKVEPDSLQVKIPATTASFGSGLKRPLELGSDGKPVLQQRKRRNLGTLSVVPVTPPSPPTSHSSGWEGFSSGNDEDGGVSTDNLTQDAGKQGRALSGHGSSNQIVDSNDLDAVDPLENYANAEYVEDAESSSSEDAQDRGRPAQKERTMAFKAWATQQRHDALDFQASNALDSLPPNGAQVDKTAATRGVRPAEHSAALPKVPIFTEHANKVHHVPVERRSSIQEARVVLPIVAEEQRIMETIRNNDICVICGSTGSGKTTQVPQFLFEAGYGDSQGPTPGMIGITQPRRVAAVSMAQRVATELGDHGIRVAHQIRFDSSVSPKTAIKFMTDGVLLKEISNDFTLSKYSAIIIDEAHERSVNTDILIGMLSRIVETRSDLSKKSTDLKPLKLVIMSATLSTEMLSSNAQLFRQGKPPVVNAEGRQHPVSIHFSRRTEREYAQQAFTKICKGHRQLPQGAMLVFLTSQQEIHQLSRRLRESLTCTNIASSTAIVKISSAESSLEAEDVELGFEQEPDVDDSDSDAEITGLDNDEDNEFDIEDGKHEILKAHILPLYSQLPTDQQMRIFEPPPPGSRLIILSTNVAETSLTIPGVRYVIDCGRAKERRYDKHTGVQSFVVDWISKASAGQRAGRAGRTGPGHCYRLYSSAVYERDFVDFAEPEINRAPVEGVVLQLKTMGIPAVANFPFPTAPDRESLIKAEQLLETLGATRDGRITDVGKQLSLYPLSPRLARILCAAQETNIVDFALAIISMLSLGDVFIPEAQLDIHERPLDENDNAWTEADNRANAERQKLRKEYTAFHANACRFGKLSDSLKMLSTFMTFARSTDVNRDLRAFTRVKAIQEATRLQKQLASLVSLHTPALKLLPAQYLPDPTPGQVTMLAQVVAAGYLDQIAQRADLSPTPPGEGEGRSSRPRKPTEVPYLTLFPTQITGITNADEYDMESQARLKYVYAHPSSALAHTSLAKMPQFVVYSHLSKSSSDAVGSAKVPRTRMHPLTPISAAQIISMARGSSLLYEGKPLGRVEPLPRGADGLERRKAWVVPCLSGPNQTTWPLPPAARVVQRRNPGTGWVTERVEASI